MDGKDFEWDDVKAGINLRKHKVSFDEGATIFNDPFIATIPDPDHSEDEQRFIALGKSISSHLLLMAIIYRNDRIRIISCRKATNAERKIYEENI